MKVIIFLDATETVTYTDIYNVHYSESYVRLTKKIKGKELTTAYFNLVNIFGYEIIR